MTETAPRDDLVFCKRCDTSHPRSTTFRHMKKYSSKSEFAFESEASESSSSESTMAIDEHEYSEGLESFVDPEFLREISTDEEPVNHEESSEESSEDQDDVPTNDRHGPPKFIT
jgi:hypothetical protein